jgi:hypothetical protein
MTVISEKEATEYATAMVGVGGIGVSVGMSVGIEVNVGISIGVGVSMVGVGCRASWVCKADTVCATRVCNSSVEG